MPVEATTDSPESRCPVRRSGRQPKRTDKLEEFLMTTKRGSRKSAPPSVESGDPPSQTPTDAETASEASFDGNAESRAAEDKAESPERRTRSSIRKQAQKKTPGGRQTRSSGRAAVQDEGSSENEEDGKDEGQSQDNIEETKDAKPDPGSKATEGAEKKVTEETNKPEGETEKETDDEDAETPAVMTRRPVRTYVNKKKIAKKNPTPAKAPAALSRNAAPVKKETKPTAAGKMSKHEMTEEEEDDDDDDDDDESFTSSSSSTSSDEESDDGGYDPNALYCICRQKHNKRFMICCDRCEEWFHGDCVGITEARGRLMERNGEDYICPNCTAKKNQVVRPAMAVLPTSAEANKPRADVAAQVPASDSSVSAEKLSAGGAGLNPSAVQGAGALSTASGAEDQGIKGRIEKATNPSGKKKIKIFQPAIHQPAVPKADQKATSAAEPKVPSTAEQKAPPEPEQRVETTVEVNTTPAEEAAKQRAEDDSSLPKCIGPGCDSIAQPDSVYCGNDCILKHAAAAMKSITDVKEPKQKDKSMPQKNKSTAKKGGAGGKAQKKTQRASDSDEDFSPDLDEDDEDEYAEEQRPPPSTASWSSDHNYIAVTPEKTTPISPTVLNKKSPPKEEKTEKERSLSPDKSTRISSNLRKGKKKSPPQKSTAVSSKSKKSSPQASSSKVSKKQATTPTKTAEKSKKPGQAPAHNPSPFPAGPIHVTGALRVTKSNFTIPKKQPQQKDSPSQSQPDSSSSSSSRVPSSPASSTSSSRSSSSRHSHPPGSSSHSSPVRPPANNQMRQNIRRSLTDILFKRVSDSDDLKMTESEVGKLAYGIEKEMFNLCLSTDSKYKNKYRTLMFNLKDPKNKGLFYRVIGGQVTPFRLVRLTAEELLSKEISEWRKSESSEGHSRGRSGHSRHGSRHETGSHSVDMDDAPPSDADDQDEACSTPSASAQPSADGNTGSNMVDVFSSMLKDTTSEHKTHLFDLNCKICTGQKTEDELASKKARVSSKPDVKPPRHESRSSRSGDSPSVNAAAYPPLDPLTSHPPVAPPYHSNAGPVVPETPPQLYQEDPNTMVPPAPTLPLVAPTVSSVSISRRDPRMARHGSAVSVVPPAIEKPASIAAETVLAPITASVAAPMDAGVKVPLPLPLPPAPPPVVATSKSTKKSSAEPPPEGETAIFLYGQETIWKGFVNMQSVAKFVTKAYLVSGSFEHLKEDLPDTIHIGGRISPNTVWDYVGKLKTSLSKELCLIRFQPATEEEEVAYVSLFSYFSSRKKFGVVANNNRRIKDLYLIPLGSKDPLPSRLLPFDGPGLEPARPNLLLGLLICQKDRKRAGAPLETDDKRSKMQTKDADETGLPKPAPAVKAERSARQSLEIPFSTTPPGSPPSNSSETISTANTAVSVLSLLSAVNAPVTSAALGKDSTSGSSAAASASAATPLQTILNTIFRNKKLDSDASNSPSDQTRELPATATMLDPIVQQFTQNPRETPEEEDEDDRPYDPEEEYDPSLVFNVSKKAADELIKPEVCKPTEVEAVETDDVEYDPEDDSIFDDVKTVIPAQTKPVAENVPDAKMILENLRRIGDQALQKQAEQQTLSTETAATALLLPNTLASSNLLQLGKKVEELVKSSTAAPLINQRRDPRQSRDPRQAVGEQKQSEPEQKEEPSPPPLTEPSPTSAPLAQEQSPPKVEEHADAPQGPEASLAQEEEKSETMLPFMDSDNEEVSIPLLGEEVEHNMEVSYMTDRKRKRDEDDKEETKVDKYSIWPNAASILKAGDDLKYEENSQDVPSSRYRRESADISTVTSAIPVLTQSTVADAHPHHMPHHMASFDNEYRPPVDVPPQSSFVPPHPMQGQNLIMRPPPQSMLQPMQGPPLMSGPPSMQGPPPAIHVPPSVHGPPPRQVDGSQQYGPTPTSYPPYQNQNQWPNNQHQQQQPPPGPPIQNILPPRGPPLQFPPVSQRAPPPQIFDPSMTPQHIGLQGPPPNIHPLPNFEGQNNLPPPRFSSPLPPFNFPANRGPPPAFTGPPPSAHFDTRHPPPALFPGPRGPPPNQHYNKDTPSNSFNPSMDQNPNPPQYFKENLGPPAPSAYRGPPPDQYEDRRGLPPSAELSGQLFQPHNQYGGSRPPPSSPLERRSFDEPRGLPAQENRPHLSQFSERYRFDWHSDDPRPVRHGMPLLPPSVDGLHGPPSRHGGQSPDLTREEHWRRLSPEMRRRSSATHDDLEPRSVERGERGERLSRFDIPHRELSSGSSQSLEERQRELSEDHRREREKESPHGGRPPWDRGIGKRWSREQEWDRGREREREPERGREGDRSRGRDSEKTRDAEGERHKDQDSEKRRERDREKERERDRDKDRDRPRESDRKDYDRDRARNRDRDRERERDRRRDRSRSRDRDRGKDRGREREREKQRDRERDRDRERERDRDRDRDQDKRSKEKKEDKRESKRDSSKEKTKSTDNDKHSS